MLPKKSLGLEARDDGRAFAMGLEIGLGSVGLNELAAGLGLKSRALTLNFVETAEVGVRTVLEFCELGTVPTFAGLLGGFWALWIGSGAGIETGIPSLCLE